MSGYEPVLHALSVEPRVARPGDLVRLVFRSRNLGARPSPAGTVRFALPAGLEPLEPPAVEVAPVAPGTDVVAVLRARIAPALDDRSELIVRAALELTQGPLETNACAIVVRSSPQLDGPASGVTVVALDGEIVRVAATVVNEGDGPACGLRLSAPVPAGCVALDGEATELALARLDVGQRAGLAYDARIVRPVDELRPEAYAQAGTTRCALPVRADLALAPALAAPRVELVAARRRLDLTIALHNDGWVDASGVRATVTLPRPLRRLAGELLVDGVPLEFGGPAGFARIDGDDADEGGIVIEVARVAARAETRISLALHVPPGCPPGSLRVASGQHEVSVPFVPAERREMRLRVLSAPAVAEPGAAVEVVAELANAGDRDETVTLAAGGAGFAAGARSDDTTIAPGAAAALVLTLHVRDDVTDGAPLGVVLVASDGTGECARARAELSARDRAWLALSELPARTGEQVTYALRNAGSTSARRVVAVVGDETHQLGSLAPGAQVAFAVSAAAARRGGTVRVAERDDLVLPTLDDRPPAEVEAALDAPADVVAGAPFVVRVRLLVVAAVETLALRIPAVVGADYVPGSTRLDGRALLDRGPASPLAGEGLVLRGIPAATHVTLAWSLLADAALCEGALTLGAELEVDGDARPVPATQIALRAREPFAARPAGLPYHVDACALAPDGTLVPVPAAPPASLAPVASPADEPRASTLPDDAVAKRLAGSQLEPAPAEPASPAPRAVTLALRLDGERRSDVVRLLRGAQGDGLVVHLLALRALFPADSSAVDAPVTRAVDAARTALCDVYDRLFVTLRIPGFDVSAADLEDTALRRGLVGLFEELLAAAPVEAACDAPAGNAFGDVARGSALAQIERDRLQQSLASLAEAPLGAPTVLRALVALVPTRCDDAALGAALARFAAQLDGELARCERGTAEEFDDALARGTRPALGEARAELLAALQPRRALAAR